MECFSFQFSACSFAFVSYFLFQFLFWYLIFKNHFQKLSCWWDWSWQCNRSWFLWLDHISGDARPWQRMSTIISWETWGSEVRRCLVYECLSLFSPAETWRKRGAPLSGILSDSVILNMDKVLRGSHVKDMIALPHTFLRVLKIMFGDAQYSSNRRESQNWVKAVVLRNENFWDPYYSICCCCWCVCVPARESPWAGWLSALSGH